MRNKWTLEKFLEKAKLVHGNKYDYSLVNFNKIHDKIDIICPIHGIFKQSAFNHIAGQGCVKCYNDRRGNTIRFTTAQFIEKANITHDNKYDYSKVKYVNTETKVCIICPIHGEFWQTPHDHLDKHGCPMCGKETKAFKKRKDIDSFIKEANLIHNYKYDYSLIKEINNRHNDRIQIICPEHGVFEQRAAVHLKGHGCQKCGGYIPWTKDGFCEKANSVHNNKYDYSKIDYKGVETKVCIICPIHGEFWQTPHTHLNGSGCPHCKTSKGESCILSILQKYRIQYDYQYKIHNDKKSFVIDFCIKNNEKLYFIEYNGKQHYEPIEFFGGEEAFALQTKRDYDVRAYCLNNNIELLEISYELPFEEIEKTLIEHFNKWKISYFLEEMMEKSNL